MGVAKVRFGLALVAFVAWLSYLLFLAIETRENPVVLARPQFLISTLDVIAEVDDPDTNQARIVSIHWPQQGAPDLVGKTITVTNLAASREDWTGPGKYILPLQPEGANYRAVVLLFGASPWPVLPLLPEGQSYRISPLPRSPGFAGGSQRPRIYPATPETLRQLEQVRKAAGL